MHMFKLCVDYLKLREQISNINVHGCDARQMTNIVKISKIVKQMWNMVLWLQDHESFKCEADMSLVWINNVTQELPFLLVSQLSAQLICFLVFLQYLMCSCFAL